MDRSRCPVTATAVVGKHGAGSPCGPGVLSLVQRPDHRRDKPLRRRLQGVGVQGRHLTDLRPGLEMQWWSRPLEKVYAAVFIDAIMVKMRQVRSRPVYAAIGVGTATRILGDVGRESSESAKFWLAVLRPAQSWGQASSSWSRDGVKGCRQRVRGVPVGPVQTCISI